MSAVKRYVAYTGLIAIGLILGYTAGKLEENLKYDEIIALDQGANVKEAIEMLDLFQKGKVSSVEKFHKRKLINSLNRYHHLVGVNCDDPINGFVSRYIHSFDYSNGDAMADEWNRILERVNVCFE